MGLINKELVKLQKTNFFMLSDELNPKINQDEFKRMVLFFDFFSYFSQSKIRNLKNFKAMISSKSTVISDFNDCGLLIQVKTFLACHKFGTQNWCISRDECRWNDYVRSPFRIDKGLQFILWNHLEPYPTNMISFTCRQSKKKKISFYCAFDYSNNSVKKVVLTKIIQKVGFNVPYTI